MLPNFGKLENYIGKGVAVIVGETAKKMKIKQLSVTILKNRNIINEVFLEDENGYVTDFNPGKCFLNRKEALAGNRKRINEAIKRKHELLLIKKDQIERELEEIKKEIGKSENDLKRIQDKEKANE